MRRLVSRWSARVGYYGPTQTLEVEFRDRSVYQYRFVPHSVFTGLLAASSHGRYMHGHVLGRYGYAKMSG